MRFSISLLVVAAVQLVSAHFSIKYPEWRADTLKDQSENAPYSQWKWPCAGVSDGIGNRTDWPLTGGAVEVHLHHPWTYMYVNLGFGNDITNFNVSLTPDLMNVTGKGVFCLPELSVPEGNGMDGQNASIQIVTNGASGEALYNCADITLRANVSAHQCKNDTGITAEIVGAASATTSPNASATQGVTAPTETPEGAAAGMAAHSVTLTTVVGLAVVFVAGLGL